MSFTEKIEKNRQNFIKFNESKILRFQQLFTNNNAKKIINSIPLFLSLNHPKVPGYIEGKVPVGISGYVPDDETIKYFETRFHIPKLRLENKHPFIEMLAIMGSVGTIAYTKTSDFDYWVCIDRRAAGEEELVNLQKKIDEIQRWVINEIGLEVHLFLNDIGSIKNNIYAEDEDEAFGSATGATLKDEFFRSSIIIAGKIPFWWVIPRIKDEEYERLYNQLSDEMKENQFIDIGNLYEISKEDFLGAALFQLVKALANPFKSIIKIGVLEKYLFGSEKSPLLSHKVKARIQRGQIDINILDSYVLMFEEVYAYYEKTIEDKSLLKILKQNLYLKINPQLSKYATLKNNRNLPYKVTIMFAYVKKWGWSATDIKEHDDFDNWDYRTIIQFWNNVKKFMLLSYQKIAQELPALNLAQRISETDFKLISRKIKTNFTSGEDEIDQYITFKDTPHESILYIEPVNEGVQEVEWRLYRRNTSSEERFLSTTLKTDPDLMKLLAWTCLNRIFDPTFSRLKIQSGYSRINQNIILELLTNIHNLFVTKNFYLKNEYFLKPSFNILNMVIINFNLEHEDNIKTIHFLYRTSWGQSYLKEYNNEDELLSIMQTILQDGLVQKKNFDDYCIISTPEPHKKIYRDIQKIFKSIYESVVLDKVSRPLRLTTNFKNKYITICRDGSEVSIIQHESLLRMFAALTLKSKKDVYHDFMGDDPRIKIMREIYASREKDSLTITYEESGDMFIVYVLNENGNIFTSIKPMSVKEKVMIYIYNFCAKAIGAITQATGVPTINNHIYVKKLAKDKYGTVTFTNESSILDDLHSYKYSDEYKLSMSISKYSQNETLYSIQFPDKTKTAFLPLKTLTGQLATMAKTGTSTAGALNMIHEINFTDLRPEDYKFGSTVFLLEKYRLEILLDRIFK